MNNEYVAGGGGDDDDDNDDDLYDYVALVTMQRHLQTYHLV